MKPIQLFLVGLTLICMACKEVPETPDEVMDNFQQTYQSYTSMSYEGEYLMKYFSQLDDTNKYQVKVDLIRDDMDTLLGGMVWIEADSTIRYWNTRQVYIIDLRKQEITEFPEGQTSPIQGHTLGDCIGVYFLKPEKLEKLWQDSTVEHGLLEDSVFDMGQWMVNFDIPADDFLSGGWKRVWLDKNDLSLLRTRSSYDMQGENQYRERIIKGVRFDQVDSMKLADRLASYLEKYPLEIYSPSEADQVKPLAEGTMFPPIRGLSGNLEDSLDLNAIDAQLVILDFWYMDCFPCIKAISHLNEVAGNYDSKKLKVVGVNPFDNNEKGLDRLPNFLEHNPIDYPIMFVDREAAKTAHVRGYPTFYVLNEERKVVYSGVGYSEDLALKLDSVVGVYLGKP